jgi:NAD-dependent SIR2 family protein deacetylase
MADTVDAERVREFSESPEEFEIKLDTLAKLVRKSKYTVFFTGAGISTSAGIRDYRGPSGAWTQRRINQIQDLGEEATDQEKEELQSFLENQENEQAKRTVEKSVVYLPLDYRGERVIEKRGGLWRLKEETELTAVPQHRGIAYRRSKDRSDALPCGLYWGSFVPAPVVDEGDGWLRCDEIELDATSKQGAQPTLAHMAQVTLMKARPPLANFVVTTNLDGLYRQAGLQAHEEVCFLHGDTFTERCSNCGYDFERNYNVRNKTLRVHDHHVGKCSRCGSKVPAVYTGAAKGRKTGADAKGGFEECHLVGTCDKNVGTKDTHINFGEYLDERDLEEAAHHCSQADLCIVMGTSMSLRHITHFPFAAKKTVIVNLQQVPDDTNDNKHRITLRIRAQCDPVCEGLLRRLKLDLLHLPKWRPRDALPPEQLPSWLSAAGRGLAIERWEEIKADDVADGGS